MSSHTPREPTLSLTASIAAVMTAESDQAGGGGPETEKALGGRGSAGGGGRVATVGGTVIREAPRAPLPESAICRPEVDE